MAIYVSTLDPDSLLAGIYQAIDNQEIHTWVHETYQGESYFTFKPRRWYRKAFLEPSTQPGFLTLNIVSPIGQTLTRRVFGVYQSRFIEMLIVHFHEAFSDLLATSSPAPGDKVCA